jgi:hypothetical protein
VPAGAPACPRCGAKQAAAARTQAGGGVKLDAETKAQMAKYGAAAVGGLLALWALGSLFGGAGKDRAAADASIPRSVPAAPAPEAARVGDAPDGEDAPQFPPLPTLAAAPAERVPEQRPTGPVDESVRRTEPGPEREDGTFDGSGMREFMESRRSR